jgi:myosin-5
LTITNKFSGLQTPRLKRLAEIVSAQAIAQQEKLDYPLDENNELTDNEMNGV